jgi:phytoene dehydrogenase-like protein
VIGSGPNGLTAAITLAQAGLEVVVHEAAETIGGGMRSAELTLPGFVHDVCSSVLPLARISPALRAFGLDVEWVDPAAPAAHPLDDGTAVMLEHDLDATAERLGPDGDAYRALVGPLVTAWAEVESIVLGPHPVSARDALALTRRLGLRGTASAVRAALSDARSLAEGRFHEQRTRAWIAGHCAHSLLPLERRPSAGFGLTLLILGHVVGWSFARGGSQRLAEALVARLRALGGEIRTDSPVDEFPRAEIVLADTSPREFVRIARGRLPPRYERALLRYRHGPGVFKLDWALDGPIPWRAQESRRAGTVHLGGSLDEISRSEWAAWNGARSERPFVLLTQPTLFDATRAPPGKHIAWAYCHVPNGSAVDMTEPIEAQVERFAPGFRNLIAARHVLGPAELQAGNRNLVGGDINGGAMDLRQLLFRPVRSPIPYRTPLGGVYLCSSATPPGGGVHGMCGYSAALVALRNLSLR